MKYLLFIFIAAFGPVASGLTASAQEIIPQEFPKKYSSWMQERVDEHEVTDTLSYELPNDGIITILYNSAEYAEKEIDEKLRKPVSEAIGFPAGKQLVYHLVERYPETDLQHLFMLLSTKYAGKMKGHMLMLGLPAGIDYIGGHFTPEIGLRADLHIPKYNFGVSLNDVIYFQDKESGGVKAEHNPFINLDFAYSGRKLFPDNYFQIGYLLKKNSTLFEGTTLKAVYKYQLKKIVYLQAGAISTDNFKQIYPIFGITIF